MRALLQMQRRGSGWTWEAGEVVRALRPGEGGRGVEQAVGGGLAVTRASSRPLESPALVPTGASLCF